MKSIFKKIFLICVMSWPHLQASGIAVYNKSKVVAAHPKTIAAIADLNVRKDDMIKFSNAIKDDLSNVMNELKIVSSGNALELQKKREALEKQFVETNDALRALLAKQSGEIHKEVMGDVRQILKKIQEREGYDLIVPSSEDMVFKASVDISEQIIGEYSHE